MEETIYEYMISKGLLLMEFVLDGMKNVFIAKA